jgi:hypothetical protein
MTKLVKLPAPPFWSRWQVGDKGIIEKRGMSSLWTALDAQGHYIRGMLRTRQDAVRAVEEAAS